MNRLLGHLAFTVVLLDCKSDQMRKSLLKHDGDRVLLQHVPFPSDDRFYGPLITAVNRPNADDKRMVTCVGPFVE